MTARGQNGQHEDDGIRQSQGSQHEEDVTRRDQGGQHEKDGADRLLPAGAQPSRLESARGFAGNQQIPYFCKQIKSI